MDSRRRVERVHLKVPLPARIDDRRAFIIDASTLGLRIAHQVDFGEPDTTCHITFDWDGQPAEADCRIVRTTMTRQPKRDPLPVSYDSGLEIVSETPDALRSLVAWHVGYALDERKANWKGIPPVATNAVQTGASTDFVRHELIGGLWRELPTRDPRQPRNGFTVSVRQSAAEVRLLRKTFETGDRPSRELLQRLAEMSISNPDGVPTRRYTP